MEIFSKLLLVNSMSLAFVVASIAALFAGFSDYFRYKIPNSLTFSLMAFGFVYHSATPFGNGWTFALGGFLLGFFILLPFFLIGAMGAGDVKLLAALGACLGLHDITAIFLVFGTLAGIYSATMLVLNGQTSLRGFLTSLTSGRQIEEAVADKSSSVKRRIMPLAPMICVSVLSLGVISFIVQYVAKSVRL